MKRSILLSLLFFLSFTPSIFARDYDHSIQLEKMAFHWNIDGELIHVKVSAKTKGWVGIGFNPQRMMKGANIIIGYVKKGKLKISDEFGVSKRRHRPDKKIGGKSNLTNTAGTEKNGTTELSFTIPLDSGDSKDGTIRPNQNTKVIFAYGSRDSFRSGHKYHTVLSVNLSSGKFEEIHGKSH